MPKKRMPFRIDLAGGWLDQPFVSKYHPGSVITISIEPTINFNHRSGMASSTRNAAQELWGNKIPAGDLHQLAKILFCYENPPGTEEVSGAQDSVGIVFPGLNKSNYEGKYWPTSIDSILDEETLGFLEDRLYLVTLGPRKDGYAVLSDTSINKQNAKGLAEATENCWKAILEHDAKKVGKCVRKSFEAQIKMFPHMIDKSIKEVINKHKESALGWKLSGAGGGGYLIIVSEKTIPNSTKIVIRKA